ncbi:MAG TPA: hypothetical protein VGC99_19270 [Candidatus Tectomicrobia bacterium]
MKVTMLLADAAEAVNGKLYILGGGWSITSPQATPSAIAIKIDVPWDLANTPHTLRLDLLNEDGRPVMVQTPMGEQPMQINSRFEVGRPVGLTRGTDLEVALAINIGPLPLTPGARYVWRCSINDDFQEGWELRFSTRPAVQKPTNP